MFGRNSLWRFDTKELLLKCLKYANGIVVMYLRLLVFRKL